jgi:hypothetical protein
MLRPPPSSVRLETGDVIGIRLVLGRVARSQRMAVLM